MKRRIIVKILSMILCCIFVIAGCSNKTIATDYIDYINNNILTTETGTFIARQNKQNNYDIILYDGDDNKIIINYAKMNVFDECNGKIIYFKCNDKDNICMFSYDINDGNSEEIIQFDNNLNIYYVTFVKEYNGDIYYKTELENKVYAIKNNNREIVLDNVDDAELKGNNIFYRNSDGIFIYDIETNNLEKVINLESIISSSSNEEIKELLKNNVEESTKSNCMEICDFYLENNELYFSISLYRIPNKKLLYKYNFAENECQCFTDKLGEYIVRYIYNDGNIYYINSKNKLMRYDMYNGEKSNLTDFEVIDFEKSGNILYLYCTDKNSELYNDTIIKYNLVSMTAA